MSLAWEEQKNSSVIEKSFNILLLTTCCLKCLVVLFRALYQILEDKQHHGSCNLSQEDNQHNTEELNKEENIIYLKFMLWDELNQEI